jgi:hypothetical protein
MVLLLLVVFIVPESLSPEARERNIKKRMAGTEPAGIDGPIFGYLSRAAKGIFGVLSVLAPNTRESLRNRRLTDYKMILLAVVSFLDKLSSVSGL